MPLISIKHELMFSLLSLVCSIIIGLYEKAHFIINVEGINLCWLDATTKTNFIVQFIEVYFHNMVGDIPYEIVILPAASHLLLILF